MFLAGHPFLLNCHEMILTSTQGCAAPRTREQRLHSPSTPSRLVHKMAEGKVITDLMSDGYHVNTSCIEQHTCWIDIYSHFPKTISHTRSWNVSHVWNLRCWMSMVHALADTHFQKQLSSLQKASSENPWKTAHIWYFFNISLWFFSNKNPINYGFSTGTVFSIHPNTGVYAHIWPYLIVFFDQIDIVQNVYFFWLDPSGFP